MKLFTPTTEIINTQMSPKTVLKKMEQKGAVVIDDNFMFIGAAGGGISGYVITEDNKTKVYLKSEMSGGAQIFGIFWIIGTLTGLIGGIYQIIDEQSFNWLPIISLGMLVFGVLIIKLLSSDQSSMLKSEIRSMLYNT